MGGKVEWKWKFEHMCVCVAEVAKRWQKWGKGRGESGRGGERVMMGEERW